MKKENLLKFIFGSAIIAALALTVNSCTKDEDPCDEVTCQNGGSCNDGNCTCATGYQGSLCETEVREKFVATYECSNSCLPGSSWTCVISKSATGITKVVMTNMGNTPGLELIGTVDGNNITILSQTDNDNDGDSWTVEGTGSISGTTVTLNIQYTFNPSGTTLNCTESWVKS